MGVGKLQDYRSKVQIKGKGSGEGKDEHRGGATGKGNLTGAVEEETSKDVFLSFQLFICFS